MSNEVVTTEQPVDVSATKQVNTINYNPVFPIMTANVLLDLPVEDMSDDILKLAVDTRNYSGGYTTFFNGQNIDEVRGVKALKEAIYGISCAFGREMKYEVNYDKCSIQVWANVMRKGGYHAMHSNNRSMLSGTFHARIDDKMSPLVLKNPTQSLRAKEPYVRPQDMSAFTSETLCVKPEVNTLHIWPAWMEHEVPEMTESGPRITFSFSVDFLPPGA